MDNSGDISMSLLIFLKKIIIIIIIIIMYWVPIKTNFPIKLKCLKKINFFILIEVFYFLFLFKYIN